MTSKDQRVDRKSTVHGTLSPSGLKRVPASFFRTETGNEPVREWLKRLTEDDRRAIGQDIRTVEYGWPIGMPTCRSLGDGLHEIRTNLRDGRIARVFFYIDTHKRMILLHGFLKKTQKTPEKELELARSNKRKHERESDDVQT